jgi:hypothetical protein
MSAVLMSPTKSSPELKLPLWRTILVWVLYVFLFLYLAYVIWSILQPIIEGIEIGKAIGAGGMG